MRLITRSAITAAGVQADPMARRQHADEQQVALVPTLRLVAVMGRGK